MYNSIYVLGSSSVTKKSKYCIKHVVVRKNPRKIRLKRWNRREIMKKLFIMYWYYLCRISTFHTTKSIAIIARRTSQNKPEFFVPIAPTLSIFA
jgi:hypothetical protein